MTPRERHTEMLQEIQEATSPGESEELSDLEAEFIDSAEDRLGDDKPLTHKQAEWLKDIWARVVGE